MGAVAHSSSPFSPKDRKLALMAKGVVQADLATELGVSPFLVSRVMRGRSLFDPSPDGTRVARRIAAILGHPLELVFPELA